jgi:hypothetical protein
MMKAATAIPTEAYPLAWPPGAQRTLSARRRRATFHKVVRQLSSTTNHTWRSHARLSVGDQVRSVRDEVGRIPNSSGLVISTNLPTRNDGMPRATALPKNADPGAAVYWAVRHGRRVVPYVMPCDTYDDVADNLHAIALSIGAMRALDRWGAVRLEQAFAGFAALPPGEGGPAATPQIDWREALGGPWPELSDEELLALARDRHRRLILMAHPDRAGGSHEAAALLNAALDAAEVELAGV